MRSVPAHQPAAQPDEGPTGMDIDIQIEQVIQRFTPAKQKPSGAEAGPSGVQAQEGLYPTMAPVAPPVDLAPKKAKSVRRVPDPRPPAGSRHSSRLDNTRTINPSYAASALAKASSEGVGPQFKSVSEHSNRTGKTAATAKTSKTAGKIVGTFRLDEGAPADQVSIPRPHVVATMGDELQSSRTPEAAAPQVGIDLVAYFVASK